ncbi:MAG TPA: SsrA-binding protein SmpB [Polyangia bacterium]|jgi:SsrA-binding protein
MAKGKAAAKDEDKGNRSIVRNRKARHEYEVLETIEAGVALVGSEVKSLRDGKVSLVDAYAEVRGGELWLVGADIAIYVFANQFNHDPRQRRKLLVHKQEIRKLDTKTREKGLTLVPLELYFKNGKVKALIGLVKGKRQYDRRDAARKRDQAKDLAEQLG